MNYPLGKTGIEVSKLCFGTLTLGPYQRNLSIKEGAKLIREAVERGVTFFDTAECYDNYPYLKEGLKGIRDQVVIATKTYAYSRELAEESLKRATEELGGVDIFLLHEQESINTLRGHEPALRRLIEAKEAGDIRAVGMSTHKVEGVKGALEFPEIDVVHPLFNKAGIGILDGSAPEMLEQIQKAHQMGKGIYGMKALAGGHLADQAPEALSYVLAQPEITSVAVGIGDLADLEDTLAIIRGEAPTHIHRPRHLYIEEYCRGCGQCVEVCPQKALALVEGHSTLVGECVLCSYCARVCPDFCVKVW